MSSRFATLHQLELVSSVYLKISFSAETVHKSFFMIIYRRYEFAAAGWQTSGLHHTAVMGTRQTMGMGYNSPGHLCRVAHKPYSQEQLAANRALTSKTSKYGALSVSHVVVPVAIKTAGTWGQSAIELVQAIGKRITSVTEDTRETMFLFKAVVPC